MRSEVEPWLRGTLGDVEPMVRAVLHALELAGEDTARWCDGLSDVEMFARPMGLPHVGFQLRHIVRSLDRLLTYAEGGVLLRNEGGRVEERGLSKRQNEESGGSSSFELRVGRPVLSEGQMLGLRTEMDEGTAVEVLEEFRVGMEGAMRRVKRFEVGSFAEVRSVGRKGLPTTVVGLLVHCAEHTQRHVGQMVTTVKVVRGLETAGPLRG